MNDNTKNKQKFFYLKRGTFAIHDVPFRQWVDSLIRFYEVKFEKQNIHFVYFIFIIYDFLFIQCNRGRSASSESYSYPSLFFHG